MTKEDILSKLNTGIDVPFALAVKMGRVEGVSSVDKFGVNREITEASAPEDIWEFGGLYTFDANGTAPIKYISCANALDTGQTIQIQGLDIDGSFVLQEAITDGQDNVVLATPLWRVFRMQNVSVTGKDLVGILYCHTDASPTAGVPADANVRAIINDGNNQTLMTIYTIPKGKVGFLVRGEIGISREGNAGALAEYAHCHYEVRQYGKIFTTKKAFDVVVGGGSVYQDVRSFPDAIPSLTDLKLRCVEISATMGIWCTFDLYLVDEDIMTDAFLASIGQMGY